MSRIFFISIYLLCIYLFHTDLMTVPQGFNVNWKKSSFGRCASEVVLDLLALKFLRVQFGLVYFIALFFDELDPGIDLQFLRVVPQKCH